MILALHNVRIEPSNVRKKIREPPNVTKVQSHVMLVLHNETAKCEEKIKVPPNVRKIRSNMMVLSNVIIEPSNVRKK